MTAELAPILAACAVLACVFAHSFAFGQSPLTRAESSGYLETTRYDELIRFLATLEAEGAPWRRVSFGRSSEGRDLPLLILGAADPSTPAGVRNETKPRVFVMANIHAGEVEGKEACLVFLREVAQGKHEELLRDLVLLIAPIYNADGNERIAPENRALQNGPVRGVGVRTNAQGLDLNRDFMKLESPEARALVRTIYGQYDPHLVVDLHTTNGSAHGYALTFAPPLVPAGHPDIIGFLRKTMLVEARAAMKERGFETYYYGNFKDHADPAKGWETFDHRPRFGNNYAGLRNRFTVLSEAYSYCDFRTRIDATYEFLLALFRSAAKHAQEIRGTIERIDRETVEEAARPGPRPRQALTFKMAALPDPVEILASAVQPVEDPETGLTRLVATGPARPVRTFDWGVFEPASTVAIPVAYLLPPTCHSIVEKLLAHGIRVERLVERFEGTVEAAEIAGQTIAPPFQGHKTRTVEARLQPVAAALPPGSYLVATAQPLRPLVVYLLEAGSDDGLVTWNFFDRWLAPGEGRSPVYPVYRLMEGTRPRTEIVSE